MIYMCGMCQNAGLGCRINVVMIFRNLPAQFGVNIRIKNPDSHSEWGGRGRERIHNMGEAQVQNLVHSLIKF